MKNIKQLRFRFHLLVFLYNLLIISLSCLKAINYLKNHSVIINKIIAQ